MKVSTRRGRAIMKLRRQGKQVLVTIPWPNTASRQILWWEPSRYGKEPWGVGAGPGRLACPAGDPCPGTGCNACCPSYDRCGLSSCLTCRGES